MTYRLTACVGALVVLGGLSLPAPAQETPQHGAHMGDMMSMPQSGMQAAMATMMQAMDVPMTGNPDVDFVRMMIPHHQGAIDMARIELEEGKDPLIRKLAEDVIAAQEDEIDMMQAWLAKQPQ